MLILDFSIEFDTFEWVVLLNGIPIAYAGSPAEASVMLEEHRRIILKQLGTNPEDVSLYLETIK